MFRVLSGDDVLGLLPVNAADHVLHVALSALGLVAAFASPNGEPLRTTTAEATGRSSAVAADREGRLKDDGAERNAFTGAPRDRDAHALIEPQFWRVGTPAAWRSKVWPSRGRVSL